jgi:two-component SAPR family response regulator
VLGEVIRRDRDRYSLDRSLVRVDVDELEGLVAEANRAGGHEKHELLEKALALYRGEPLARSDFSWSEGEIRRLCGTYVELLDHVGRARLGAGDGRGALHAAERGLAVDTLNESLWRLAMEAESALGLRESLSERYETLSKILNERLGLEPDRETRRLHRRLLSQA